MLTDELKQEAEPLKFIFTASRNEEIGDFATYDEVNARAAYLADVWGEAVTVTERFDKANTWVVGGAE